MSADRTSGERLTRAVMRPLRQRRAVAGPSEGAPTATTASRGPLSWLLQREARWSALIALAVIVVYVVITASHGALGASRNDDWVYFRTAYHFADDGTFAADPWSMAMLVGQVILAAPLIAIFGHSIVALQLLVALLGAAGLWAAYAVIRSMLSPLWSAFAVGCLAVGPVYGSVSLTYMTDVPSFAFQMLSLLAGLIAIKAKPFGLGWFGAALAFGLFAFSIREYAVAATMAVGVAAFFRARAQSARLGWLVAGFTVAWLVLAATLYHWRSGLADSGQVSVGLSISPWNTGIVRLAGFTLALFVIPLVPLISLPRLAVVLWRHKWPAVLALVAVVWSVLQFVKAKQLGSLLGNYLTAAGSYPVTTPGIPPDVMSLRAWHVVTYLSLIGLAFLLVLGVVRVAELVRAWSAARWRPTGPPDWGRALVLLYALAAGGVLIGVKYLTISPLFDRYLIPLVPFVVALTIRVAVDNGLIVKPSRTVAAVSLGAFAVLGIGMVDTAAALDGTKWRLAESVVAQGYPAASIDGGYEWFGYYQPGLIAPRPSEPGRNFYITLFADRPVCVTSQFAGPPVVTSPGGRPIVISERTGHSVLGVTYHLVALAGPQQCQPEESGK